VTNRNLDVVHLLVRSWQNDGVRFLVYPHKKWLDQSGHPYLVLPTKKTVTDPLAPFLDGTSLEKYVDEVLKDDLQLGVADYTLEQEIEPVYTEMNSPTSGELTRYTIYPVDVWVNPARHASLQTTVQGAWLSCGEASSHQRLSPTAQAVFHLLRERETELDQRYAANPQEEQQPEARRRLLKGVPDRPSMDALAKKWLRQNRGGVRHLAKRTLDDLLAAGSRALNLRVADPYLRYQMQGVGFTWSFFTHKDPQDVHVHGAPIVEIYGVLEGRMEIWWKAYLDRGTSAWSYRIVEAGDWVEVDSLQCHIVHWLTKDGKGVVFKAGPGPLAEVGKLGVKGKTRCNQCPCMKPERVVEIERG
jgi:hypothetical protein